MRKNKDMELALDTPARLRAVTPPPQAEPEPPQTSDADLLVRVAARDQEGAVASRDREILPHPARNGQDTHAQRARPPRRRARGRTRMTRPPDFDELLGADVAHDERERLRRVHELLLEAGPPPEVSPEIAYGPTLGTTLSRRGSGRVRRRVLLLAAAVLVLAIAFLGGYLAGNGGGRGPPSRTPLKLSGATAAPGAPAALPVGPPAPPRHRPVKVAPTRPPEAAAGRPYT